MPVPTDMSGEDPLSSLGKSFVADAASVKRYIISIVAEIDAGKPVQTRLLVEFLEDANNVYKRMLEYRGHPQLEKAVRNQYPDKTLDLENDLPVFLSELNAFLTWFKGAIPKSAAGCYEERGWDHEADDVTWVTVSADRLHSFKTRALRVSATLE